MDRLKLEEQKILKIAWDAVKRRREEAKNRGQLKLDGVVREIGYVTYEDFEQYMEEIKQKNKLLISKWDAGRIRIEISNILLSKEWVRSQGHPETRFYPPANDDKQLPTLL